MKQLMTGLAALLMAAQAPNAALEEITLLPAAGVL